MESITKSDTPITVVIHRIVRKGHEADFEQWIRDVGKVVQDFPGLLGTNIITPSDPASREYIIIFRFDSYDHLLFWERSAERRAWLAVAQPWIEGEVKVRKISGLEYWFSVPEKPGTPPPPRWKMVAITWLALFPVVLVLPPLLLTLIGTLPYPMPPFFVTGAMVLTMTYLVMPLMTRLFRRWLYGAS